MKVGVLNNVDMQFVLSAYTEERTDPDGGPTETAEGFGDVIICTKVNLWGNDGGDTAVGVMPFVKIPTGTSISNGHAEGGVIAMMGWDAGETWGLGFQGEVDFVYDEDDRDYDTELLHTIVLGFEVAGPLGAYVEYIGVLTSDSAVDYLALFSSGLTLELTADMVLDVGTQIGLTNQTDDVKIFAGLTVRF